MRISSCFVSRRVARGRLTSDSSHNRIESNSRVGLVHAGCAGAWTSTNPRKPSRLLLPNCYHLDGQAAACSRAETCRTLALLSNLSNIHSTSGGGSMARAVKYTKEMLEEAVRASSSMAAVLRCLGLRPAGGAPTRTFPDVSEASGSIHPTSLGSPARASTRLTTGTIGKLCSQSGPRLPPVPAHQLRRALFEYGISHICALCGIDSVWNGMPLTLHVDHIDGNPNDSRPGNVRFLCPNCHSQTPTYAGRNLRQRDARD